ncbi:hypothetical protein HN681_00315 [archaeon]|jgi:hypothetical protein|nr:hypothetical protein [archaeon]MBT7237731.1 hypothetical protein [Candidatus Woesearchaeota archaeon]MBT3730772.1 hypothetical protein [archaeon]MBT4669674.1 hypothetical protein [archaeon]MBT7052918.1 hypothetical protein [archaeon]
MGYSWGSDTTQQWTGDKGGFDYGEAEQEYDASKAYVKNPKTATGPKLNNDMSQAYEKSKVVMDAGLTAPEMELLSHLGKDDILITNGRYDSAEKVLDAVGTLYTMVNRSIDLNPNQIVLVNCPGNEFRFNYKGRSNVEALRSFVEDGGFLVTTDWALQSVIMRGFEGYIKRGSRDTSNDLVEVDLVAEGSPYTKGLGGGSLRPVWWLESSSYPIKITRESEVDILLSSSEMGRKYNDAPIAVKFPVGQGRVVHVTSHFFLQQLHTKYEAQAQKTGLDFATKFLGMAQDQAEAIGELDNMAFGALESAYTSVRFMHNIFLQKLRAREGIDQRLLDARAMPLIGAATARTVNQLPDGRKKSQRLLKG